jgi:hypothetical protein
MRTIGSAERALESMCKRLMTREAFGKKISEHSVWEQRVAEARINIDMCRLLTLKAADMMDKVGNKIARTEIAMIKVAAPRMALKIIDDAIQAWGGAGVTTDPGLARMYAGQRTLRLADGPDEVHNRTIARLEFGNQDMSGGLTKAWLESTLLISPDEELRFWERYWREQLPVSKHAYAMTKAITLVETSPSGWTLHGKTGSGAKGAGGPRQRATYGLGWFVGHVAKGGREYVFVASYTDRVPSLDRRPAGWVARDMAKKILEEMGLY